MNRSPPGHCADAPIRSRVFQLYGKSGTLALSLFLKYRVAVLLTRIRVMRRGKNKMPKQIVYLLILVTGIYCKIQGGKVQSFLFHLMFTVLISYRHLFQEVFLTNS